MPHSPSRRLYVAILAAALAACSDSPGPGSMSQVQFSASTRGATPASAGMALASQVLTDAGGNTLQLDTVKLVLREIEFKRAGVADSVCPEVPGDGSSCEELKVGPLLLDLPLGAGAEHQFTVAVDTGTYERVDFDLHKPEDAVGGGDSFDASFLALHPEYKGVSIHVVGTWNGVPFVYQTDLDAQQETTLPAPLVVGDPATADVTLRVDLDTWFRDGGGSLVDPSSGLKGQPNESLVNENIKSSFEAFEDSNHDGLAD